MDVAYELKVRSDLALVGGLAKAVRSICEEYTAAADVEAIELAITEAVTNVIRHGYAQEDHHSIRLSIAIHSDMIAFELVDQAPPMDPAQLENASASLFAFDPSDTAELPEGGMGLALIKMSMDDVQYSQRKRSNLLRMTKMRTQPMA